MEASGRRRTVPAAWQDSRCAAKHIKEMRCPAKNRLVVTALPYPSENRHGFCEETGICDMRSCAKLCTRNAVYEALCSNRCSRSTALKALPTAVCSTHKLSYTPLFDSRSNIFQAAAADSPAPSKPQAALRTLSPKQTPGGSFPQSKKQK